MGNDHQRKGPSRRGFLKGVGAAGAGLAAASAGATPSLVLQRRARARRSRRLPPGAEVTRADLALLSRAWTSDAYFRLSHRSPMPLTQCVPR